MASAGLLKVIHSGMQDERLLPPKGQPKTDFFQTAFMKAGRFTTEWYRVDFDNRPSFGSVARATLPRRGHLITRAYLVTQMPDLATQQTAARAWCTANGKTFAGPTFGWTNSIGHALVQQAQVTIAAEAVSTLDGRLMEVLDEFQTPLEKTTTVNRLLGRYDNGYTPSKNLVKQTYVTPLPFWFSRGDPSAALPIDAIGTDPVQMNITFAPVTSLYQSTQRVFSPGSSSVQTLPELPSSPFYYLDSVTGTAVAGLQGNPARSQLVSQVPGITMPSSFALGSDTYIFLEYVYLDKPEANRIRVGDLSYPIVNHYAITPYNTKGISFASVPLRIPNPTRDLYFMCHRTDADLLNAPFLATRDLSGLSFTDLSGIGPIAPWWPDASGLSTSKFLPLIPAYSQIDSEPLQSMALVYEGRIVRYASDAPAFFRSILPALEQRKTPWHNKYYYHLPFGTQHHQFGITQFAGEANLDKITRLSLELAFQPMRGNLRATDVPEYTVYVWAECYNILRVYGGRAGLLFKY
jgi:hypothetical protein